ncbi:hypothetical protein [Devosia sp. CN2-171]|uniref:hypothetical protein n=1 Tax=Devosia sp. CN2-171 TaxID=3400909 RepID=UPI003BF83FC6
MSAPRTPRQFADAGMVVLIACRCGHEQRLDPLMVEFTCGENFDLAADWRELSVALHCEACGSPRPIISFSEAEKVVPEVRNDLRRAAGGRR